MGLGFNAGFFIPQDSLCPHPPLTCSRKNNLIWLATHHRNVLRHWTPCFSLYRTKYIRQHLGRCLVLIRRQMMSALLGQGTPLEISMCQHCYYFRQPTGNQKRKITRADQSRMRNWVTHSWGTHRRRSLKHNSHNMVNNYYQIKLKDRSGSTKRRRKMSQLGCPIRHNYVSQCFCFLMDFIIITTPETNWGLFGIFANWSVHRLDKYVG